MQFAGVLAAANLVQLGPSLSPYVAAQHVPIDPTAPPCIGSRILG